MYPGQYLTRKTVALQLYPAEFGARSSAGERLGYIIDRFSGKANDSHMAHCRTEPRKVFEKKNKIKIKKTQAQTTELENIPARSESNDSWKHGPSVYLVLIIGHGSFGSTLVWS